MTELQRSSENFAMQIITIYISADSGEGIGWKNREGSKWVGHRSEEDYNILIKAAAQPATYLLLPQGH